MVDELIRITLASIATLQSPSNALALHNASQLAVSAVPVCAASHVSCSGSARMFIVNDYEAIELDNCSVRADQMFELSTSGTRVPWLHCQIRVEVALEGHVPTTLDFSNGCEGLFELGPWRIGTQLNAGSHSAAGSGTQPARSDRSANVVRFALTGGDPDEAIARIGGLGPLKNPLTLSAPGVRRIDAQRWEFDLDLVDQDYREHLTRGFAIPHTTSGSALWKTQPKAVADSGLTTFEFDAPANLCTMVGRVVDARGAPVVGACVTGYGIGYERGPDAITSDDGRFEFENLRCGQCWFFVSDDRWSSHKLQTRQADLTVGSRNDLVIVVEPQRQLELDARLVEFSDARFVVMIIEGVGLSPCHGSRVLVRSDLTRVLTLPASWGPSPFNVKLVAVPRDGMTLNGDIEHWAHEVTGWRTAPVSPRPWIAGSNVRATLTND